MYKLDPSYSGIEPQAPCTLGSTPRLCPSLSISFVPDSEVHEGWGGDLEVKWIKFLLWWNFRSSWFRSIQQ